MEDHIKEELRKVINETVIKQLEEEHKHLIETKIPRCIRCKKDFINTIDTRTKELSKYLWKADCQCFKEEFIISYG